MREKLGKLCGGIGRDHEVGIFDLSILPMLHRQEIDPCRCQNLMFPQQWYLITSTLRVSVPFSALPRCNILKGCSISSDHSLLRSIRYSHY